MAAPWYVAGLLSRCPECAKGPLFEKLLKFRDRCPSCGTSFADADAGDGPAVFVILVAGIIVVPVLLIVELALRLPLWAVALLMVPFTAAVVIGLLRPFKATLYALQRHHRAGQGKT